MARDRFLKTRAARLLRRPRRAARAYARGSSMTFREHRFIVREVG